MRVAVLTFFNNGNFGSELQAIAMSTFLQNLGHEPVFCKCGSTVLINRIIRFVSRSCKNTLACIFNREYRMMDVALRKNASLQCRITSETKKKVREDSRKLICSAILNTNELKHQFDAYICGSDQIWSPFIMPIKKEYYLPFVSREKKIAYAPSFGVSNLPEYHKRAIRKYIDDFQYLSVREKQAISIVEDLCGKKPSYVCDPTMLLSPDEWNLFLDKYSCNMERVSDAYVLVYCLSNLDDKMAGVVNEACGGESIFLQPKRENCPYQNGISDDIGVFDFLELIKNAKYVITDSFHGTVFSILFRKQFVVIPRNNTEKTKQASRIESLLDVMGIKQRYWHREVSLESLLHDNIDYERVFFYLDKYRSKSQSFLRNALEEIEQKEREKSH